MTCSILQLQLQFYINFSRQKHQKDVLNVLFNAWDSQVSFYTPFHFSLSVPLTIEKKTIKMGRSRTIKEMKKSERAHLTWKVFTRVWLKLEWVENYCLYWLLSAIGLQLQRPCCHPLNSFKLVIFYIFCFQPLCAPQLVISTTSICNQK